MQEAGTTICPAICSTDTERESQARVSSKPRQTREVRFWRPKREAQKACVSEVSLPTRDVQQREVRVPPQRHETCVSTTKSEIEKVRVSQLSLTKCDNQQQVGVEELNSFSVFFSWKILTKFDQVRLIPLQ